jgi:hypothetical protein
MDAYRHAIVSTIPLGYRARGSGRNILPKEGAKAIAESRGSVLDNLQH